MDKGYDVARGDVIGFGSNVPEGLIGKKVAGTRATGVEYEKRIITTEGFTYLIDERADVVIEDGVHHGGVA